MSFDHPHPCPNSANPSFPSEIGILFTDLDGTLLNSRRTVSRENRAALDLLKKAGVVRVIATGRSPFSFFRAIQDPGLADYLIFSSGAGIFELASGKLLQANNLGPDDVATISTTLTRHGVDFMVHRAVPDNHHFVYHDAGGGNDDFFRRIDIYRDFAHAHDPFTPFPAPAAQVIAVMPYDPARFSQIRYQLTDYQVTRTTSPLDHHSIWMEIGPADVHKGSSAAWLCRHLKINPAAAAGIGNDYNDVDLLNFTPNGFLLANGPAELHHHYRLAPANDDNGFCHAVFELLS